MISRKHRHLGRMPKAAPAADVGRVYPLPRGPNGNSGATKPGGPLPALSGGLVAASIMARRSLAMRRDRERVARTMSYRRVWS
jgi:hypothetical protein